MLLIDTAKPAYKVKPPHNEFLAITKFFSPCHYPIGAHVIATSM